VIQTFQAARRRPINETGQAGVDLGSRNFNWSLPLLNLPGRAGLDLNLTLSYNSLVWTKDGSFMKFNADLGSPAPGFRVGLPTLQQRFLNPQTGIYAYMMVTPSGGRVELRQVGASNIYESQDGSYTQLDVSDPNALLVRTTDGTQFTYKPVTVNNEYRCTKIKDHNGNYISADYNWTNGHLQTITDTLGRLVTFVYDGNSNLQAIQQTWNGSRTIGSFSTTAKFMSRPDSVEGCL
jgi:YD repeat-containing protein